jgi:hypothetical protein
LNEQAQKLLDRLPDFVFSSRAGLRQPRSRPAQLQPWSARANAGSQRHRHSPGTRRTNRRVAHALDSSNLTDRLPAAKQELTLTFDELALIYKSLQAVKTLGALPSEEELLEDTIQLFDQALNDAIR